MSEGEVRKVILQKQQELGVTEKKDTGTLMKAVMTDLQGKVDGSTVAKIVNELLK